MSETYSFQEVASGAAFVVYDWDISESYAVAITGAYLTPYAYAGSDRWELNDASSAYSRNTGAPRGLNDLNAGSLYDEALSLLRDLDGGECAECGYLLSDCIESGCGNHPARGQT